MDLSCKHLLLLWTIYIYIVQTHIYMCFQIIFIGFFPRYSGVLAMWFHCCLTRKKLVIWLNQMLLWKFQQTTVVSFATSTSNHCGIWAKASMWPNFKGMRYHLRCSEIIIMIVCKNSIRPSFHLSIYVYDTEEEKIKGILLIQSWIFKWIITYFHINII